MFVVCEIVLILYLRKVSCSNNLLGHQTAMHSLRLEPLLVSPPWSLGPEPFLYGVFANNSVGRMGIGHRACIIVVHSGWSKGPGF